jgi:hypothetical protein
LKGLKASHYRLTYDHRSTLQIKDLLLSDHARFPIFHIEFQNRKYSAVESVIGRPGEIASKKEKKRGNSRHASVRYPGGGVSLDSQKPRLTAADVEELALISAEKEAVTNGCAFSMLYTEQHQSYGFGEGGEGVNSLYTPMKYGVEGGSDPPATTASSSREGRLIVKVRCVSCLLSSTDIPLLIAEAMPAYHRVRGHIINAAKRTRHSSIDTNQPLDTPFYSNARTAPDCPIPTRTPVSVPCDQDGTESAVQTSVYLSLSHLDVALTTDEHLLARLYLDTIEMDLASIPVFSTNRSQLSPSGSERGGLSLRASVQALKLFDLTHAGSLHPIVIWKKDAINPKQTSSSASRSVSASHPPIPMITVALMVPRGEKSRSHLTVSIQGLRACVLYRFIEEISTFITHRFIKAIHEAISCSFPDSPFSSFLSSDVPMLDEEEVVNPFIADSLRSKSDSYSSDGTERGDNKGVKAKEEMHASKASEEEGKDSISTPSSPPIEWCIELRDCTITVPRNSGSNDSIAVAVNKGTVQSLVVPLSWSAPEAMQSESGQTLFFDPIANIWRFNMDEVHTTSSTNTSPRRSDDSDDFELTAEPSIRESNGPIKRPGLEKNDSFNFSEASSSMQSINSSLFESIEEGPLGERPSLSRRGSANRSQRSRLSSMDGEDLFFDAYDDLVSGLPPPVPAGEVKKTAVRFDIPSPGLNSPEKNDGKVEEGGSVSRLVVNLQELEIFVSLSGPLKNQDQEGFGPCVDGDELREFCEVTHEAPMYRVTAMRKSGDREGREERESKERKGKERDSIDPYIQKWKKCSLNPINLFLSIDRSDTESKVLLTDTVDGSPFAVNLTMGELNLCISIWFDNFHEKGAFLPFEDGEVCSIDGVDVYIYVFT